MANSVDKWIDLSGLPTKQGFGDTKDLEVYDWIGSIGYKIPFKYAIISYLQKGVILGWCSYPKNKLKQGELNEKK